MTKSKLLLADDSITIQKVVDLTFADEGIEVITVGDGNSAMDKIREDLPDLVMADVNMPGLNGYEICEKIKQSQNNESVPVILLVGAFEPFDEVEAKRVGADDYLKKPFQSINQLVKAVSSLLDSDSVDETVASEFEFATLAAPVYTDTGHLESQPVDVGFSEPGIDDEMIETDRIGNTPIDEVSYFDSTNSSGQDQSVDETSDQKKSVLNGGVNQKAEESGLSENDEIIDESELETKEEVEYSSENHTSDVDFVAGTDFVEQDNTEVGFELVGDIGHAKHEVIESSLGETFSFEGNVSKSQTELDGFEALKAGIQLDEANLLELPTPSSKKESSDETDTIVDEDVEPEIETESKETKSTVVEDAETETNDYDEIVSAETEDSVQVDEAFRDAGDAVEPGGVEETVYEPMNEAFHDAGDAVESGGVEETVYEPMNEAFRDAGNAVEPGGVGETVYEPMNEAFRDAGDAVEPGGVEETVYEPMNEAFRDAGDAVESGGVEETVYEPMDEAFHDAADAVEPGGVGETVYEPMNEAFRDAGNAVEPGGVEETVYEPMNEAFRDAGDAVEPGGVEETVYEPMNEAFRDAGNAVEPGGVGETVYEPMNEAFP